MITERERRPGQGDDHLRGRERAGHAGGRRDPRGQGRPDPARRPRERRRRRRLVLRMGAGPPGVLLEGGRGEREAERHRQPRVRRDVGRPRRRARCRCASPRTVSPCSASPRRRSRVASTRKPRGRPLPRGRAATSASARSSRCASCGTSSASSCARSTSRGDPGLEARVPRVAAGRRDRRPAALHVPHPARCVPSRGCTSGSRRLAATTVAAVTSSMSKEEDVWRIA